MNSAAGGAGVSLMPAAAGPAVLPAVMPAVKRPALVDSKTGLPVYQPLPAAAAAGTMPYHQLSAVPLQPQARYFTLPSQSHSSTLLVLLELLKQNEHISFCQPCVQ